MYKYIVNIASREAVKEGNKTMLNNKFFVEFDIYFSSAAEGIKEKLYNICDKIEITQNKPGVYHFKLYIDDAKALTEVNKIVNLIYCNVYKNQNYIEYKAG